MASPDKLGRRIAALMAGDGAKPIRAYHGSPYDFDRFDASKIGTGEGAQAYGHGLYFAENPAVALEYKRQFQRFRPSTDGRWSQRTVQDAEGMLTAAGSHEAAIQRLEALLPGAADDLSLRPQIEDAISYLRGSRPPRARMYEVELGVPENALLDWDRPIGLRMAGSLGPGLLRELALSAARMAEMGQLPRHQERLERIVAGEPGLATGEMLYRAAGRYDPPDTKPGWSSFTNTINDSVTNQSLASTRLAEAGIPGIRYLDGNSRASGGGTRNYVMFPGTEDHIRILRKYGLLAPMALPALQEAE
jgi:hypothetical protein